MDHLRGGWLQAKPDTGTCICSPKRGAGTTWLLQPTEGQDVAPRAYSTIQISVQYGRASNPLLSLHFWESSPTSEVKLVQYFRRPNRAERLRSTGMEWDGMGWDGCVKQILAHFGVRV